MNAELAKALVAAQKEMPAIEPDAVNPHFKSKFVSLDHLLAVALPVLHKHGLGVAQFPSVTLTGEHALTTVIFHESGNQIEDTMPLILPKNDPQGQGSALTYARRYALAAALGISGEKDDDGARASEGEPSAGQAGTVAAAPKASAPTGGQDRGKQPSSSFKAPASVTFKAPASVNVKASVDSITELYKLTEQLGAKEATEKTVAEREDAGTLTQEWVDRCIAAARKNIEAKKKAA